MTIELLLDEIAANPDDDEPRLVWADAVGGERGELVVIQCALARGGLPRDTAIAYRKRERELLASHAKTWNRALENVASHPEYRRGFAERAYIDVDTFTTTADALFAIEPALRDIRLSGLKPHDGSEDDLLARLSHVLVHPSFAKVTGLHFYEVGRVFEPDNELDWAEFHPCGGRAVELLLETNAFEHLHTFAIEKSAVASRELVALANAPQIHHLRHLEIGQQHTSDYRYDTKTGVRAIIESPHLTQLDTLDLEEVFEDLTLLQHPRMAGLRSLDITRCRLEHLTDALVAAPFTRLARLRSSGAIEFDRLGSAPGMRHLEELSYSSELGRALSPEMVDDIARASFPALKVLRIDTYGLSLDVARTIVTSPLAQQLEVLDLGIEGRSDFVSELAGLFDGILT
ncbi:MAG: hypothetical protein QM831_07710 [Kofleriaceae bacterium]